MDARGLAAAIDQTLLKPNMGEREAREWMQLQRDAGFASLCVSPFLVPAAAAILAGTSTKVCTVVAFPLGYALSVCKAQEAARLVDAGATEIDMVMNFAAALEGSWDLVGSDIAAVVAAAREASGGGAIVKVILETGYLDEACIAESCRVAVAAGADFVKTSTGFGPRGASIDDVRIMRDAVGPEVGVKAAGGIRQLDDALALLAAGASRIGTSGGLTILGELEARSAEQPRG
jgi:deoxyribose-phosphate aldolase